MLVQKESKLLAYLLNYPTNCTHKLFNSLAPGPPQHCLFTDGLIPSSLFVKTFIKQRWPEVNVNQQYESFNIITHFERNP